MLPNRVGHLRWLSPAKPTYVVYSPEQILPRLVLVGAGAGNGQAQLMSDGNAPSVMNRFTD